MKSRAAIDLAYGEPLVVDDIELPDPQPDQVIVKLMSSGVCHSQLHQIHNANAKRPAVMGHEGTGVVTHVGRDVTHVNEGDHAIVTWVPRTPRQPGGSRGTVPTGATYREEVLSGEVYTWSEDVLTSGELVVPIGKEHPTDVSCIVGCAVLTGAGAVLNTAKVRPEDSVAVFGVGGVGMSAIRMASILGAYPLIAVDLRDEKLEFAAEFGATHFVNASETDPVEAVKELTGGGADYAFDAIGLRVTNEQILPSVRGRGPGANNTGGTAVLIGVPGNEMTLNPRHFFGGQRTYTASWGATYPEKEFAMYLRWHQEGKFPLDRLITRRYKLDEINEACADLVAGEILGRAIIEY